MSPAPSIPLAKQSSRSAAAIYHCRNSLHVLFRPKKFPLGVTSFRRGNGKRVTRGAYAISLPDHTAWRIELSCVRRVRETPWPTLTAPGILYKRAGFIALNRARPVSFPVPYLLRFPVRARSSSRADTNTAMVRQAAVFHRRLHPRNRRRPTNQRLSAPSRKHSAKRCSSLATCTRVFRGNGTMANGMKRTFRFYTRSRRTREIDARKKFVRR